MTNPFFEQPVLNSPYEYPVRHWELDDQGRPTQQIIERHRRAEFITPIPKPRKQKGSADQQQIVFDEGKGLSTQEQQYDITAIINRVRQEVDQWRSLPSHINWIILDSDWEAEFCRVAESHPRVKAYVKNHNLGLEVPYRYGSETRRYIPDFIALVDDSHGENDLLHLIVAIKGYRREDAKEKKATMDTCSVPGVNNSRQYGRWAFAEFTDVYQMETDFEAKVEVKFNAMIDSIAGMRD